MKSNIDLTTFRRFLILLYKGLLLRKRHYIATVFEIIIPIFVACIPVIIYSEAGAGSRRNAGTPDWVDDKIYPAFDPLISENSYYERYLFVYAPSNPATDILIDESVKIFKGNQSYISVDTKGLTDGDELEYFCMAIKRNDSNLNVLGTLFEKNMKLNGNNFPPDLEYTIRSGSDYDKFRTNLKYQFSEGYNDAYSRSKFLSWQAAVEKAFISRKMKEKNSDLDYELWMQRFPYPGHKLTNNQFDFSMLISVFVTCAFLIFVIILMRRVIEEKANGSKELFKMMGMTNFNYWFSTFLNYFVVGFLVFLIVSIIYISPFKGGRVLLQHSNFLLVYIIFLIYIASLILFCFAMTTFFNKAVYGIIVMMVLYNVAFSLLFILVFLPGQIEVTYFSISAFAKFCICLLPPGALLTICHFLMAFEASGEGLRWSNLYSFDAVPDFNASAAILSMLFSCFLYAVITWYVDAVWPWQYGVPKPLYFPFTKSYWFGYDKMKTEELLDPVNESINMEVFEEEPTGKPPGVVISNLSKVFKTGLQRKVAVNNVSLNMYNGQITALLGHNGAGKTTTINILTGLFAPSGGTASINGWDICSQTTKARQSLGVCPQHNVLYDTLTVEEHLKIYAVLKGVMWSQINNETNSVLILLGLMPKRYELAKNLSGGMKRKLSLGIAFIGGSKVLFLDEPTSGLDVEARRKVWDTLMDIRHDRTIILTTHYMEEADILGDRIAIMADGEIQCCGSSMFLKKKFGTGYHMHLVKKENFNLNAVQNILSEFVPNAVVENEYEGEVTFNLMSNSNSNFGPLFEKLECNKNHLGVNSCGITVTTMEDVFLHVAHLSESKFKTKETSSVENVEIAQMTEIYKNSRTRRQVGSVEMFVNHFYGLVLKRLHYSKRHWGVLLSQLILPFLIMCLCLYVIKAASSNYGESESALKLDLKEIYGETDSFYHSNNEDLSKLIAEKLKEVLQDKGANVQSVEDPQKFVIDYGKKNIADYYKNLIVGGGAAEHSGKLILLAWYNGFPYHSLPISLLSMDTAILKAVTKSGHITLTNDPLPQTGFFYVNNDSTMQKIMAGIFVPLAFSFLAASFVLIPIHERATGAKLLQFMTGIYPSTYWLSMFVWDFFITIIISLLLIIPYAIFGHYAFFAPHSEAISTAILLMILYGWACIPFSYLLSLVIKKPNVGFSVIIAISIFLGVAVSSIYSSLIYPITTINGKTNKVVLAFSWILGLFPSFAVSSGFSNLFAMTYSNAACDTLSPKDLKYNCVKEDTYYPSYRNSILMCCKDICGDNCLVQKNPLTMDVDACGRDMLLLFLDGVFYFVLLLLFEFPITKRFIHQIFEQLSKYKGTKIYSVSNTMGSVIDDPDVVQEEQRVHTNCLQLSHSEALVTLALSKQFKNITAVDRLTFAIHKEECFGLLGVNGAGKTTTFRMLTGDCYFTSGNAFIGTSSVATDLTQFQSHIGYCPQFDALIDRLTAREMISLFARLRGLSGSSMTRYVDALINMTDLTQYADKPSMVYSGGNKRKLSIALALIGAPPLLFLDEPTAGVDPVSRRKIWKILSLARIHSGAAVILTTHSMEESEALCSRLAIMVNGRFRCLGSIQHLKSKFGQGYTLIVKMKNDEENMSQSMNAVKVHIETNLPGATLKDDHQGMLQYHIVDPSVTLSRLFTFMDDMKKSFNFEDYVISDTSLEQIFLTFAKSQRVVAS